jgi:hypothetical protein
VLLHHSIEVYRYTYIVNSIYTQLYVCIFDKTSPHTLQSRCNTDVCNRFPCSFNNWLTASLVALFRASLLWFLIMTCLFIKIALSHLNNCITGMYMDCFHVDYAGIAPPLALIQYTCTWFQQYHNNGTAGTSGQQRC